MELFSNQFSQEGNALVRFFEGELLRVEPYGIDALRVRSTRESSFSERKYALINVYNQESIIKIGEESATIKNGKITAEINKNGKITFKNDKDKVILEEKLELTPLKIPAREFKPYVGGKYEINMRFISNPNEKIFGMGQYQQPFLDIKGCVLELSHRNSQASVPFMVSSLNYGFLWNVPAIGEVSFGKNITQWNAKMGDTIDYVIIAGDTPKEIEEKYMSITGKPPMMPDYALGFWQSKLRYQTRDELVDVAREYKKRNIPLSVIVCDFFHWPHQGDWKFDTDYFPDPKSMVKELNEMGTELMVSVWPTVEFESENFDYMKRRGMLIKNHRGPENHMVCVAPAVFYDATNPEARKFVWETIKKNYYDIGIKTFWLDEAEPEFMLYDYDNHKYYLGDCLEVGNIYPLTYAQNFYEGMKSEGQENIVNLIRCAWAGSQRYGALVWSGDIMPTFDALKCQIRAGLNMAMSGIGWWTTDIGGFDSGYPDDKDYRELVVRWFEYATFCPVLRMHGYRMPYIPAKEGATGAGQCFSGSPNEIWSYGDEAYEIMKDYIFLRERIKPYVKSLMQEAHEIGTPPMRPLFYDYPSDDVAWNIDDEYMFGDSLLVAPIMELGQREREVYLPKGSTWIDVYTGNEYKGGIVIGCEAPIDRIPLFITKNGKLKKEIFNK
ncbi:MAG: family 31 glucosidase [Clostridia bacterium]|nr:family 31 glucosidase [Clostridia bacterium]